MAARKFFLLAFLFLLSLNVSAQERDDAVKEKRERELKLLEQILADAKNLRLPENRAIVAARIGNALWQADEKRARKLFADAAADLVAAQTEAQAEKGGKQFFQALIYGQTPRIDIINTIAARDAELALDLFSKTRPPAIAEAMQNPVEDNNSTAQHYARQEIQTEQRLLGMMAEQNPQTAAQRVRESLKKGVSYEISNLLGKIYAKDPQTADKLAEEVGESFLNLDFSKNYQTAETAGYFVGFIGRPRTADEKGVKISDDLLRRLVMKMTDDWLASKNNQLYGYWNSAGVVERLFPERAARIKKKLEVTNNQTQTEESQEYTRLMSSEIAPEEMVARAEKLPSNYRNEVYRQAAQKFANNGNYAQAEKILQGNVGDEQAEYYLSQFYTNTSYQLANQGKYDEAAGYINRIADENQRINALINLANAAYQKDKKENQKLAERILGQARALVPDVPETQNDLNAMAYLATAYAPIEPDESFRLIESILPTLNELNQANFVLMKFRAYGGVRQNEMQIVGGNNLGIYNLENTLRALKEKDFERTLQFTDGIQRLETRIWLQIQLLDENLSNIISLPVSRIEMISLS
jgi:hypothetical protein